MVYTFPLQRAEGIDIYSDTDWSVSLHEALNQRWQCDDGEALHTHMEFDTTLSDPLVGGGWVL